MGAETTLGIHHGCPLTDAPGLSGSPTTTNGAQSLGWASSSLRAASSVRSSASRKASPWERLGCVRLISKTRRIKLEVAVSLTSQWETRRERAPA